MHVRCDIVAATSVVSLTTTRETRKATANSREDEILPRVRPLPRIVHHQQMLYIQLSFDWRRSIRLWWCSGRLDGC